MGENFQPFYPDNEPESVGLRWDDYKEGFQNFMIKKNGKKFGNISAEVIPASFLHYVGKKNSRLFRSDGTENAPYKRLF